VKLNEQNWPVMVPIPTDYEYCCSSLATMVRVVNEIRATLGAEIISEKVIGNRTIFKRSVPDLPPLTYDVPNLLESRTREMLLLDRQSNAAVTYQKV
jgi:hypothetical protein